MKVFLRSSLYPTDSRAQSLFHHLHELDGFENERGFNNIKIHDKLYNATDLLTDLISNGKSRYAIDSNIINFLADSNIPLSLIRNKGILKDVQNLRRISSEQVTESDGSFASVNSTVLESPSQSPIKSRQRFKTGNFRSHYRRPSKSPTHISLISKWQKI